MNSTVLLVAFKCGVLCLRMAQKTWTIEMFWKCKCCNTICPGITGNERESLKCTHCGNEKTDEEWIMPNDLENATVLTGKHEKMAKDGPNWSCKYCKSESRNSRNECSVCGAEENEFDFDDSDMPHEEEHKEIIPPSMNSVINTAPTPSSVGEKVKDQIKFENNIPPFYEDDIEDMFKKKPIDSEKILKVFLIGMSMCGFIYLLVYLFTPIRTTATVSDMHWTRTENLEERHLRHGDGWRSSAPSSAFDFENCHQRQNGTEDCHPYECRVRNESYECNCTGGDSYECNCRTSCTSNRNGSATCSQSCSTCRTPVRCSTCTRRVSDTCYEQCPTYAEYCNYKYYTWDVINRAIMSEHNNTPQWPELPVHENQRIIRDENYRVILINNNSPHQTFNESVRLNMFTRFRTGQQWEIEYTRGMGVGKFIRLIH